MYRPFIVHRDGKVWGLTQQPLNTTRGGGGGVFKVWLAVQKAFYLSSVFLLGLGNRQDISTFSNIL